MTAAMIGIDPHKGSHTAGAITAAEQPLAELRVCASDGQAGLLVAWARTGRSGPGRWRARAGWAACWPQQLVAAGRKLPGQQGMTAGSRLGA
jgi:hypothetical protein